jgi:hypothetical protein
MEAWDGASIARKFGDMGAVATLDETEGPANAGSAVGDVDVALVAGAKFGKEYNVAGPKFGEVGADARVGRKFGDIEVFALVGRKFGDIAKESERFGGAVANSASKSGEVEPTVAIGCSCAKVLGHTVSAPSSTWS